MADHTLRWYINCGAWKPTKEQWVTAIELIQPEERPGVMKYTYRRDCRSALLGRLLIRKAINVAIDRDNKDIVLSRTKQKKPYLVLHRGKECEPVKPTPGVTVTDTDNPTGSGDNKDGKDSALPPKDDRIEFNTAHQWEYAVLALELAPQCTDRSSSESTAEEGGSDDKHTWICGKGVGIDLLKIDMPAYDVHVYFARMKHVFTYDEWVFIRQPSNTSEQLSRYYRLWALKESYMKALGFTDMNPKTLNFTINTPSVCTGQTVCDTTLSIIESSYSRSPSISSQGSPSLSAGRRPSGSSGGSNTGTPVGSAPGTPVGSAPGSPRVGARGSLSARSKGSPSISTAKDSDVTLEDAAAAAAAACDNGKWRFVETRLDEDHWVSVATYLPSTNTTGTVEQTPPIVPFYPCDCSFLLEDMLPLEDEGALSGEKAWQEYCNKEEQAAKQQRISVRQHQLQQAEGTSSKEAEGTI